MGVGGEEGEKWKETDVAAPPQGGSFVRSNKRWRKCTQKNNPPWLASLLLRIGLSVLQFCGPSMPGRVGGKWFLYSPPLLPFQSGRKLRCGSIDPTPTQPCSALKKIHATATLFIIRDCFSPAEVQSGLLEGLLTSPSSLPFLPLFFLQKSSFSSGSQSRSSRNTKRGVCSPHPCRRREGGPIFKAPKLYHLPPPHL